MVANTVRPWDAALAGPARTPTRMTVTDNAPIRRLTMEPPHAPMSGRIESPAAKGTRTQARRDASAEIGTSQPAAGRVRHWLGTVKGDQVGRPRVNASRRSISG